MKTVAITGSTGGIGVRLVLFLRSNGFRVYELSRKNRTGSADWLHFDLANPTALQLPPDLDYFIHCAYDPTGLKWAEVKKNNIIATQQLFELTKARGCQEFVFISSMAAFDGAKSNYGRMKRHLENFLLPRDAICIRPGLVFGVGRGLVEKMQSQISRRKLVPIIGGRKLTFHPIAVSALCHGILTVLSSPAAYKHKPVVIASRRSTTLHAFASSMAQPSGKAPWFVPIPARFAWLILRLFEALDIRMSFKSDNIVGILNQWPDPFEGNLCIEPK